MTVLAVTVDELTFKQLCNLAEATGRSVEHLAAEELRSVAKLETRLMKAEDELEELRYRAASVATEVLREVHNVAKLQTRLIEAEGELEELRRRIALIAARLEPEG
jgi:septal ring factor EnvC (AmiA/AmiB activator)